MTVASHTAYFGDAEYEFRITSALIPELEHKTGAGIGALCSRVFVRQFAQADIHETIRLALIGGGMTPARAASMLTAYAVGRPLAETYPLALAILDTLWFGQPHEAV